jgi:hypothetical protein
MGRTSPVAPLIRRRGKDLEEGRQQESGKDERSTSHHKSSRRNRRKRRSSQQQQEPFVVLFLKVGTFLFLVLVLIYYFTLYDNNNVSTESTSESIMDTEKDLANVTPASSADYMSGGQIGSIGSAKTNETEEKGLIAQKKQPTKTKPVTGKNVTTAAAIPPPLLLPQFPPLPPEAAVDAYGIAIRLEQAVATLSSSDHHSLGLDDFLQEASRLREEFASRYGGETAARFLLQTGLTTFAKINNGTSTKSMAIPESIRATARRIRRARDEQRSFEMAFGGYSVTVGRGNYFHQSFPIVLHGILDSSFLKLGAKLKVRNAAIGGIPSFPYGWCLPNFLGTSADVVSWDYSMNEAGGVAQGLEAYIRHAMYLKQYAPHSHNDPPPMLIVKDTEMAIQRRNLIQQ